MRNIGDISSNYLKTLAKRTKESRIYKPFQSTGLTLAEILNDREHKAIYIRLAKIYDNEDLIRKAKDVAERKSIDNKGAYFMKMLKDVRRVEHPKLIRKKQMAKSKKLKLF